MSSFGVHYQKKKKNLRKKGKCHKRKFVLNVSLFFAPAVVKPVVLPHELVSEYPITPFPFPPLPSVTITYVFIYCIMDIL